MKVPPESVRPISGSNRKATGDNLEEPILHATFEIIDRRAQIAVLRNRMLCSAIDAASVAKPVVRQHLDFLCAHGIKVVLKDLSFGGALPCLGAFFVDHNIAEKYQWGNFLKVGFSSDYLPTANVLPLKTVGGTGDRLEDIHEVCSICETLAKDCIVGELSDPQVGFNVIQVIVPGYSAVLPFHPAYSSGMFERWTRTDVLESYGIVAS